MTGRRIFGSRVLLLLMGLVVAPLPANAQASNKTAAENAILVDLPGRALAVRVIAERVSVKDDDDRVDAETGVIASAMRAVSAFSRSMRPPRKKKPSTAGSDAITTAAAQAGIASPPK